MNYNRKIINLINERFHISLHQKKEIINKWLKWSNDEDKIIIIYGMGNICKNDVYPFLKSLGIRIDYFCDSSLQKIGTSIDGINCISFECLNDLNKEIICFIGVSPKISKDIFIKMVENKIKKVVLSETTLFLKDTFNNINHYEKISFNKNEFKKNIIVLLKLLEDNCSKKVLYYKIKYWLYDLNKTDDLKNFPWKKIYTSNQYFLDRYKYLNYGIFIDCGAFTGDTIDTLIDKIKYTNFEKYIAYEMDEKNFSILKEHIKKYRYDIYEKIKIHNFGVGDENRKLKYNSQGESSHFSFEGTNETTMVKLDDEIDGKITFIKMDIEGSEMEALYGANRIIKKNKPVCAICIYHKINHLWEIPILLKEINYSYIIKIRHHSIRYYDTVCYAVEQRTLNDNSIVKREKI